MKIAKVCFIYIMSLFIFFSSPCYVHAESKLKIIEVDLPQNYVRCSFYVTFENGVQRKTTLKSPDNQIYEFEVDENGTLKCTVQDAKAGSWKVIASTEYYDEEIDEISTTNVDEPDNEETVEDIGKITVSVKSEEETKKEVEDSIKIAKEIAGLKYYWKDDSIVVEWKDETIGNVNISVVDSKTLKVLGKEKISDYYYELPIESDVNEIILNIVPAVSENVKGSGVQYVIKVENNPAATVTIDNPFYTNKETISATVNLEKEYYLLYEVNGEVVGQSDLLDIGEHIVEVPLEVGENEVKVYVVDEKGNMRSTSASMIRDIEPPVLKIVNDIDKISTYENSISFSGIVEEYDYISFRNEEVEPDWEGNFSLTASLKEGNNEIEVIASDRAGNQAIYKANVVMLVEEPLIIPWNFIIPFGAVLIIIIFLLFKRKMGFKIHLPSGEKIRWKSETKPIISDIVYWIVSLLCFFIIVNFIISIIIVSSNSMEPNYKQNDVVIINQLAYIEREPQRGDVIVFKSKEEKHGNNLLIKRIIGIPGDTISFCDGYVLINGIVCDESLYLKENIETNSNKIFTVPDGYYFVLGDNRSHSDDSRYWENPYVPIKDIKGKMMIHMDISSVINNYFN